MHFNIPHATKAKLRGHHLICLNFFRGEGYSEDFIENIYSIVGRKQVEIVEGPDEVCAKCPYLKESRCSNSEYTDEKIMHQDREALKLLALKAGAVVGWNTISVRVPQIIEKWKVKFCVDCGYRKVCFT